MGGARGSKSSAASLVPSISTNTKQITDRPDISDRRKRRKKKRGLFEALGTQKRGDNNDDEDDEGGGGVGEEEVADGLDEVDYAGDGNGEEDLKADDGVDFAYEGPPDLRVLCHVGVQGRVAGAGFDVAVASPVLRHIGRQEILAI